MSMLGHNSSSFGEAFVEEVEGVLSDANKKLFHYVQWHLADYITGTQGMSPEQEGIYIRFLVRLYDRGKPFPDDDRFMASIMSLDVRRWRRVKCDLVSFGKITVRAGGLTNPRFEKERLKRADELQKQADATHKYWEKKRAEKAASEESRGEVGEKSEGSPREVPPISDEKPNEINKTGNTPHRRLETRDYIKEEEECPYGHLASDEPKPSAKTLKASEAAQMAFDRYNEIAKRLGLPVANVLSGSRKQRIVARIKDAGGWQGFEKAMANLERSAFLHGKNDNGFRADFDFICQAKSFGRLLDGGYGNGVYAKQSPAEDLWAKHQKFYDGVL
jgi:uncharacterized protein YdaU (DUF1376 family)